MNLVKRSRSLFLAAGTLALLAAAQPALAQDISDAHLAAARETLSAMKATDEFDAILPRAATQLKNELIQRDPNLQNVISEVVDEVALSMAARRGDLEREAALAYARVFPENLLNDITAFYQSEAGQKLLTDGAIVAREVYKAADIWQRGMQRDLAQEVAKVLTERVGVTQPAPAATPGVEVPAGAAQPPAEEGGDE